MGFRKSAPKVPKFWGGRGSDLFWKLPKLKQLLFFCKLPYVLKDMLPMKLLLLVLQHTATITFSLSEEVISCDPFSSSVIVDPYGV